MKRLLARKTPLLLVAAMLPLLSGCSLWGASQAAANVLPLVTGSDDQKAAATQRKPGQNPYAGLVDDQGGAWQRDVLLDNGRPFDPARYQEGDPIQIRWTVPVKVGGNVQAVAGLGDMQCLQNQATPPQRWLLSFGDRGREVGEAWRVSRSNPTGRSTTRHALTLGALRAEALGSRLRVPGGSRVSWLFIVPQSGFYRLTALWRGQPDNVMDARPCINHWAQVPMQLAMQATSRGNHLAQNQNQQQMGPPPTTWSRGPRQQRRDTSTQTSAPPNTQASPPNAPNGDTTTSRAALPPKNNRPGLEEGMSLQTARSGTQTDSAGRPPRGAGGNQPATQPAAPQQSGQARTGQSRPQGAQTNNVQQRWLQQARQQLNLLGTPRYDLIRLHQAALSWEVNAQKNYSPEFRRALQTLRKQSLQALQESDHPRGICYMANQPGLNGRPLELWNGETTIPQRLQQNCSVKNE